MAEQEKTPGELRDELKRDTAGALLEAIRETAESRPGPDGLRALSEAFAIVLGAKTPTEKNEGESSGRTPARRTSVIR
ncbi:hypothetical protein GCM10028787_10630 [Brachybacterium horti]